MISAARNALGSIIAWDMYALDFKKDDYNRLMAHLQKTFDKEELQQKKGAVKKAIIDYFAQSMQCITLSVHEDSIGVKKIFVYDKKDESFDRVIHGVNAILIPISKEPNKYKELSYLWVLPEETRLELFEKFQKHGEPSEEIREYLRKQIATVFEITPKDITLFLRKRIYIRCFVPPKQLPPGVDRRFSGESLDDMQKMFETNFPNGIWNEILEDLPEVMEDSINFSTIDNETFTRTYVPVLRSMVEIILLDVLGDMEKERIEGFAGYVLRIYFDKVLRYMAKDLLRHVEARDKNTESFVKYYCDEVIVDANANKIQKYAIVDTKNQTWNYTAILSVLMQWQQVKKRIASQEEKIAEVTARLEEAKRAFHDERVSKDSFDKELSDAREELNRFNTHAQAIRYNELNQKEQKLKKDQMEAEKNLHEEKVKTAANEVEYANRRCKNKKTEVFNWEKRLAASQQQLEDIHSQSESIKEMRELIINAIATVFVKR